MHKVKSKTARAQTRFMKRELLLNISSRRKLSRYGVYAIAIRFMETATIRPVFLMKRREGKWLASVDMRRIRA